MSSAARTGVEDTRVCGGDLMASGRSGETFLEAQFWSRDSQHELEPDLTEEGGEGGKGAQAERMTCANALDRSDYETP